MAGPTDDEDLEPDTVVSGIPLDGKPLLPGFDVPL
jgi:hypothetical protein